MKQNKQNHRITKNTKLPLKHETIKTLTGHELGHVAGGYISGVQGCSSSYPICDPD